MGLRFESSHCCHFSINVYCSFKIWVSVNENEVFGSYRMHPSINAVMIFIMMLLHIATGRAAFALVYRHSHTTCYALARINLHQVQFHSWSPTNSNQTENCYLYLLAAQCGRIQALSSLHLNSRLFCISCESAPWLVKKKDAPLYSFL